MTSHFVFICLHVLIYPEVQFMCCACECVCVYVCSGPQGSVYVYESALCAAGLQGQQHTAARQRCDSDGSLAPGHS